jgi:hypothetical protein
MNLVQSITILTNPAVLPEVLKQVPPFQTGTPSPALPAGVLLTVLKTIIWVMLGYAVVLGVHIFMTFQYLKEHAALFINGSATGDATGMDGE